MTRLYCMHDKAGVCARCAYIVEAYSEKSEDER